MFRPLPGYIFAGHRDEGTSGAPQIKKESDEATAPEPKKKRKGFSLDFVPKKKAAPLPVVQEMRIEKPTPSAPPAGLLKKLGSANLVLGFDIETAGWEYERRAKGWLGQFGHYTFNSLEKLREGRIVQLGWVVARIGASSVVERKVERMVYPSGFTITPGATAVHKIDQARAEKEGELLEHVLADFMAEVCSVVTRGGHLVAHNLEFDATIIHNELANSCLAQHQVEWSKAARAGCCTMDPEIGKYLRTCFGQDAGPQTAKNTMSLRELTQWLLPENAVLLEQQHTAGADAELCLRLYAEMRKIAATGEDVSGR